MSAPRWTAPGPGSWALDDLHKPTSYTRTFVDLAAPCIGDGFAAIGERYGVPFERLEVVGVRGYLYGRMVITGAPAPKPGRAEQAPPPAVLKVLSRLHPAMRRRTAAAKRAITERRWLAEADAWFAEERAPQLAANEALQGRLTTLVATAADDGDAIASLLEDAAANLRIGIARHFRLIGVQLGVARLQVLLDEHGIDRGAAVSLLAGASPATAASRAVLDEARAAAAAAGARGPWRSIEELRAAAPGAADLVEAHLATHGHRLVGASDLDGATLVEHPEIVLAAVAAPSSTTGAADAGALAAEVRAQLPASARPRFDEALAEARRCFAVREDEGGIDMSWAAGILRHALLTGGRLLVREGRLHEVEHVFELTVEEVTGCLRGASSPTADDVAARRADRDAADAEGPPPWLGFEPAPPPPPAAFPPAMAEQLTAFGALMRHLDVDGRDAGEGAPAGIGLGVGTEVHTGRARVALEPDDLLDDLQPGDVLVTGITTPAFNAVFPLLGAVVTERGGALSHPAIAARELGIPAVIGAAGVLTMIPDGATVVVDPIAGTVTVAEQLSRT